MSTRTHSLPWHQGIEAWCVEFFGFSRCPVEERAPFAPAEAHKAERFFDVPVVMLVLPSTTQTFHLGFAHAADLLRFSTAGFRPVLVTDMFRSPALEVCDWPVEQIVPEEAWLAHGRCDNWLEHAAEHIIAAQQYFGASYVLAPGSRAGARQVLRDLARTYNAQDSVLSQALKIFEAAAHDSAEVHGFRHGWNAPAAADTQMREFTTSAGERVTAELKWGIGRGVLLCAVGELPEELLIAARSAGWSTAVLTTDQPGNSPFVRAIARACADGLSPSKLVVATEALAEKLPIDGELAAGSYESWRLTLQQVGIIRFDVVNANRVFTEVQGQHRTLLS